MTVQRRSRWERCIQSRGHEAESFVGDYFGEQQRRAILIAGGGFDPRSTILAELLSKAMGERVQGILIREERPAPKQELVNRADANVKKMTEILTTSNVSSVEVFALDGAVIGGREATKVIAKVDMTNITDVVGHISSALSKGVVFPIVRHLLMRTTEQGPGLNRARMAIR